MKQEQDDVREKVENKKGLLQIRNRIVKSKKEKEK